MSLQTKDDAKLVRAYAETCSEPAFAELVRRHLDWVHAVALRQTGEPALAHDVTQSVFVLLARKAASLFQRFSGDRLSTARAQRVCGAFPACFFVDQYL